MILILKGLYNIQMAIQGDRVTLIEVNPRGSRTVPFVDKATGRPLARWAMEAMLDEQLSPPRPIEAGLSAVKAPVFPFLKLRGLDPAPGPEMKSTGEVMGIARRTSEAYLKARMATELPVPSGGGVYITVRDDAKEDIVDIARDLAELGFDLMATRGTCDALRRAGLTVMLVHRIREGSSPDALDLMRRGEVQMVINLPQRTGGATLDGNLMRRRAVEFAIPFFTTLSGARQEVNAIRERSTMDIAPLALQDFVITT